MPTPAKWAPNLTAAFFQAFQQHGNAFDKVAEEVGNGMLPEACEALYNQHRAYLSLDPKFQSEVAFVAMVEDAGHLLEEAPGSAFKSAGAAQGSDGAAGGRGASVAAASSRQVKDDEGAEEEEAEGIEAAAAAAASDGSDGIEPSLAATRSRRTPKRLATPSGSKGVGRTPTGKRQRAGARDDDIYEYYDEGEEVTASARKRRANKRLEFQPTLSLPQPTRRKERADEAKGIDALLALAVAGQEGAEAEDDETMEGLAGKEDLEADLPPPPPPRRRTPHSTPAKGRQRPGSAHTTPGRGNRRLSHASPGLASPWNLGDASDLMGELPMHDLSYMTSPGFGLPAGIAPSPQHPMQRLRPRKQAPERSPSSLSPIKGLFGRRSSLGSGLLSMSSIGYGGTAEDGALLAPAPLEAQLQHCLTSRARRWCRFEFFCSAVDRPFFMERPMDDLLRHCGLAGISALTRKEWNLLRSGLGRPRRLSNAFLRQERCRLEQWRERCRAHYKSRGSGAAAASSGSAAVPEGEDAVLPRAISVGQRVTARHPRTWQLHDGSVLTAAHNCYRVQFDRRELGVELVPDTDVMPMDAGDYLPPAMSAAHPRLVINGRLWVDGKQVPQPPRPLPPAVTAAAAAALPPLVQLPAALPPAALLKQESLAVPAVQQQQQAAQAKLAAADPRVLSELAVALDKKEALLVQLRAMNDEAAAGLHTDVPGADSGPFKGAYANVVLQLRDVNAEVQRKLEELEREPGDSGREGSPVDGSASPTLEAALAQAPLTADSLANVALGEAAGVMAACRQKLAEAAAEASQQEQEEAMANDGDPAAAETPAAAAAAESGPSTSGRPATPAAMDWSGSEAQPLASLIQGCVWSMVLLQRGSDRSVPLQMLASALDTSLAHARPRAEANQALYAEVQEAMQNLKHQLLAGS